MLVLKNPLANSGDEGSISGLGKSPRGENGTPSQVFLLRKFHAQWNLRAIVYGVTKSWTLLSNGTYMCLHTHTHTQEDEGHESKGEQINSRYILKMKSTVSRFI